MMMMILPTMMSILLYSRDTLSRLFLFFLFFLNTILVYVRRRRRKNFDGTNWGEGRRGWNDIIRRNFFREGGNSAG